MASTAEPFRDPLADRAMRWSATLLVAMSWISAGLFGAYILAFFGGMAVGGTPERWNQSLPRLHEAATPGATLAIGAHFVTGGILLLLGPMQLIGGVRRRWPAVHRWIGRLYVGAAALAGLGGLGFILAKGTIGGPAMSLGFGLYGAAMVACAWLAFANARARRVELHRAWAIRLFALAIGSWLYRMEYGFWFLTMGKWAHTQDFRGGFDLVMDVFFYVPNLAIAEMFIRARRGMGGALRWTASGTLLVTSALLALATWYAVFHLWLPSALDGVAAATR